MISVIVTIKMPIENSLEHRADTSQSSKERNTLYYEGRTESHEQLFFACELGKADEGECGGRWNQLLFYP